MNGRLCFGASPGRLWGVRNSGQCAAVAACYYGDFYPLTSYSRSDGAWMAWQFHRPEEQDGVVQVFRRERSSHVSAVLPLQGLDAQATYDVRDFDQPAGSRMTGDQLLTGLDVTVPERPAARTIYYRCASSGATCKQVE